MWETNYIFQDLSSFCFKISQKLSNLVKRPISLFKSSKNKERIGKFLTLLEIKSLDRESGPHGNDDNIIIPLTLSL